MQDYLGTLLDSADSEAKFLFFAHHKSLLDAASDRLRKAKCGFVRIDGSTPSITRAGLVAQFQVS